MATIVAFHAHPDDESISMGGTMARAAAGGHRVVVVTATDGGRGEVPEGFLGDGQELAEVRRTELLLATRILGVARVEMLGYRDSGMMGTNGNDDPHSFWRAERREAANRLAAILAEESADVLTVYDDHGGYGHPDHIQVNRVGHLAASLAGTRRVLEVTMNRDLIRKMRLESNAGEELATAAQQDDPGLERIGTPDAAITTRIDVSPWIEVKRTAMQAHQSQITSESWFLQLDPTQFAAAFGVEWFVRTHPTFSGSIPADREAWLW
jgi:LmbE family N-acetylglucosaminyl deacetylase